MTLRLWTSPQIGDHDRTRSTISYPHPRRWATAVCIATAIVAMLFLPMATHARQIQLPPASADPHDLEECNRLSQAYGRVKDEERQRHDAAYASCMQTRNDWPYCVRTITSPHNQTQQKLDQRKSAAYQDCSARVAAYKKRAAVQDEWKTIQEASRKQREAEAERTKKLREAEAERRRQQDEDAERRYREKVEREEAERHAAWEKEQALERQRKEEELRRNREIIEKRQADQRRRGLTESEVLEEFRAEQKRKERSSGSAPTIQERVDKLKSFPRF